MLKIIKIILPAILFILLGLLLIFAFAGLSNDDKEHKDDKSTVTLQQEVDIENIINDAETAADDPEISEAELAATVIIESV